MPYYHLTNTMLQMCVSVCMCFCVHIHARTQRDLTVFAKYPCPTPAMGHSCGKVIAIYSAKICMQEPY